MTSDLPLQGAKNFSTVYGYGLVAEYGQRWGLELWLAISMLFQWNSALRIIDKIGHVIYMVR